MFYHIESSPRLPDEQVLRNHHSPGCLCPLLPSHRVKVLETWGREERWGDHDPPIMGIDSHPPNPIGRSHGCKLRSDVILLSLQDIHHKLGCQVSLYCWCFRNPANQLRSVVYHGFKSFQYYLVRAWGLPKVTKARPEGSQLKFSFINF